MNNKINDWIESLGYLYDRWQDEKEYEDFDNYVDVMKSYVTQDIEFVSASKRPFGFKFREKVSGDNYIISVNSTSGSLKKVK